MDGVKCRWRALQRESSKRRSHQHQVRENPMVNRRDFLKTSALGTAATLLPGNNLLASPVQGQLKKSVLINMLPRDLSYLDRFKLAVDTGFEGIEMQTISDPKE